MAEKILIITPVPVFPEFGGNRQRIKAVCDLLMEKGFVIDMYNSGFSAFSSEHEKFINGELLQSDVPEGRVEGNIRFRVAELINGFKISLHKAMRLAFLGKNSANYNQSLFEFKNIAKIEKLRTQVQLKSYKAVIVNYASYYHYLELFDENTRKIIDTHDRLSNRYEIFLENEQKPIRWKSLTPGDEKRALEKAEIVWAINDRENEYFSDLIDTSRTGIKTVSHLVTYHPVQCNDENCRKNLLMAAGDSRINIDGLNWFLEQVWPCISDAFEDARLIIAGSISKKLDYLNQGNVEIYGIYQSPEEVYSMAACCINPMRYGTGLKIKTLEALSFGKRVITTSEGASGLEHFSGTGLIIENSAEAWISAIKKHFDEPVLDSGEIKKIKRKIDKMREENIHLILESIGQ